jgi:hypothetical protein
VVLLFLRKLLPAASAAACGAKLALLHLGAYIRQVYSVLLVWSQCM